MEREFVGIIGKLSVSSREIDGGILLVLTGQADVYTSGDLAKLVGEFILQGKLLIVLNLEGLTYLDSSTLSCLLSLQKKLKAAGGRIALVGLQGEPLKVFQLSGFTELFSIYPDLESAREAK